MEKLAAEVADPLSGPSVPLGLGSVSETEYTVSCKKHVFPGHVVLQFDCTNTLADLLLETVRVELELGEGCEELATVSI